MYHLLNCNPWWYKSSVKSCTVVGLYGWIKICEQWILQFLGSSGKLMYLNCWQHFLLYYSIMYEHCWPCRFFCERKDLQTTSALWFTDCAGFLPTKNSSQTTQYAARDYGGITLGRWTLDVKKEVSRCSSQMRLASLLLCFPVLGLPSLLIGNSLPYRIPSAAYEVSLPRRIQVSAIRAPVRFSNSDTVKVRVEASMPRQDLR